MGEIFSVQQYREGWDVIYQYVSVPVKDQTPRSNDGEITDPVVFCLLEQLLVLAYLQAPVSNQQTNESNCKKTFQEGYLPRRESLVLREPNLRYLKCFRRVSPSTP